MKFFKKIVCFFSALVMSIVLISCIPKKLKDGFEKMEENGYSIEKMSADDVAGFLNLEGLKMGVKTGMVCLKENEEEVLYAFWFDEKKDAEYFYGLLKMMEPMFEELEEELDTDLQCKYKGTIAYFGTEQACKDFEK